MPFFGLPHRRCGHALSLGLSSFLYDVMAVTTLVQRVQNFLHPFKAQESAAHHQQRRDQPRNESADQQKRRHQNDFIEQRTLGHRPHYGQFAIRPHTGHLLGVKRQVIPQNACRFLHGHFAHD